MMEHMAGYIFAAFIALLFLWMGLTLLHDVLCPIFEWLEDRQPKCPCGCGLTQRRADYLNKQH